MPNVSQAQRRAMAAAKAGHSTLGIPQSVGAEYMAHDPGGKLPARVKPIGDIIADGHKARMREMPKKKDRRKGKPAC